MKTKMTSKMTSKMTRTIDPPIYCGFRRNDKLEVVKVTESIDDNGAWKNTIVFDDCTEMEVMNSALVFGEENPDLVE